MAGGSAAQPFARDRDFWRTTGRAALLGVLGGLLTLAFLGLEHAGVLLLWGHEGASAEPWSGPVRAVPVLVVAGAAVGWLRHRSGLEPPDPNFVDEVEHGRTEPRHAAWLVLTGLVSLVGGASLGPEAPVATAGAGLGTAVGERFPLRRDVADAEHERDVADAAFAGMSSVFGGLVTFPFAVPLVALELQQPDRDRGYRSLLPGLVSATVALAVLFPVIGAPFVGLFATEQLPLRAWHLAGAVPLGLLGAVLGVVVAVATGLAGAVLGRVRHVVVRGALGGLAVGVVAVALPLTMFSGREELSLVLERGTALGVGVLVASVAGKVVVTAVSLRAGFFGGAILPLFFIGGVAGVLVADAIEGVPLAVAVSAVAAATATALVPLPLSMLVLAVIVFATGAEGAAVPAVAVVTAHVAVHGTAVLAAVRRLLTRGRGDAAAEGTTAG